MRKIKTIHYYTHVTMYHVILVRIYIYTDSMRAHFEQFGEVEDCVVMKDHLQPPDMKRNRF